MTSGELGTTISRLGPSRIPSPMLGVPFVGDEEEVLYHSRTREIRHYVETGSPVPGFEAAGPRQKIYFDPAKLKCGIVTCGGLCPGLNDVIRAIVMALYHHYGVRAVFGYRYGYAGLTYRYGDPPLELNPEVVRDIHREGGTILGTSRGPQKAAEIVDTLERMHVGILFTIGMLGGQASHTQTEGRGRCG